MISMLCFCSWSKSEVLEKLMLFLAILSVTARKINNGSCCLKQQSAIKVSDILMYVVSPGRHTRECKWSLSASCPQLRGNQWRYRNLKCGCAIGKTAAVQWGTNTSAFLTMGHGYRWWWWSFTANIAGLCHEKAEICVQAGIQCCPAPSGSAWLPSGRAATAASLLCKAVRASLLPFSASFLLLLFPVEVLCLVFLLLSEFFFF